MKLYNLKGIAPVAALAIAFSLTSCMKDLEDGNIDPTVSATVDLNGLYNKCYAGLIMEGNDGSADFSIDDAGKSTLLRNIYNFNELPTDEGICWWSDGGITDICYNSYSPGHATIKFLYYRLMSNITFCNQYLAVCGDETSRNAAEVRVLRAYYYYLMLDFFGDAPFVEKIQTEAPLQAHAEYEKKNNLGAATSRKVMLEEGRKFLYDWIEAQLLQAESSLRDAKAETNSSQDGYGCVDKATCWFILSRLYLNAKVYTGTEQWAKAKEYANKIITCGGGFDLFTGSSSYQCTIIDPSTKKESTETVNVTAYDMLFMGNNGESGASVECLLPLLQDGKTTKGWGGSLFFIASLWNDQMRTVTGQTAGTTGNNWSGMRVRPQFVENLTGLDAKTFEGMSSKQIREYMADPQRGNNRDDRILLCGTGSYDDDGNVKDSRTADLGKNDGFYSGLTTTKWNNNYSDGNSPHDSYDVDIDFFLFRYAEVLLNYVEADFRINGYASNDDLDKINKIRQRAHASTYNSLTLDDILKERSRELYSEGIRRTDLIRFGSFGGPRATYKWDYKGGVKDGGANFDEYLNVYPLPTSEIEANSNLTQIYGY